MELLLEEKGPVAPPPVLSHPYQAVAETVMSWPGVIAATHWHLHRRGEVDGVDFYLGARELGHIHLDGRVHLATNQELHDTFIGRGWAEQFPIGGSYANWTLFRIQDENQVDLAIQLFQLNYER